MGSGLIEYKDIVPIVGIIGEKLIGRFNNRSAPPSKWKGGFFGYGLHRIFALKSVQKIQIEHRLAEERRGTPFF